MARMDEATRKRVRAGRQKLTGKTPAEAAKAVGIARQTAYTWKARLDEGGIDALRVMAAGRPAQLDAQQLQGLRVALLRGGLAHGFGTELWTLKRVRELIARLYGVSFSEAERRTTFMSCRLGPRHRAKHSWTAASGSSGWQTIDCASPGVGPSIDTCSFGLSCGSSL